MFKKIVSFAASMALAITAFAVLPEDSGIVNAQKAEAASQLKFNVGLMFQTEDYMYRDGYLNSKKAGVDGEFPSTAIGVYGNLGFDKTEGNFTDAVVNGAGHYSVSLNRCAGTITDGIKYTDRKTKEEIDPTGDGWAINSAETFNMLGLTTDLTGFVITEEEGKDAVVTYNGNALSFENAKVTIGDKIYDAGTLKVKSDNKDNLTLMAVNTYDKPEKTNLIGEYAMPGEEDKVTIEFDVKYTEAAKTSIKNAKVTVSDKTYTGKALKPAVTVKVGKKTLKKGTDYTVAYKNNKKVGKATVTIKGKGSYEGTKTATFKINPKKSAVKKLTSAKAKQAKVTVKKVSGATGYQVTYSTSKKFTKSTTKTASFKGTSKTLKSLKKGKTYYVKVRSYKTVSGKKYYSDYSAVKSVKVKK